MTSSRIVYINGHYVNEQDANVSVFDRGFLFADAVYEVCAVINGQLVDFESHMTRLQYSLSELGISCSLGEAELYLIHRTLIDYNELAEGLVYLQITRGKSEQRNFVPNSSDGAATIVCLTQQKALLDTPAIRDGLKVVTLPDRRWGRCDIKTVQLLYASMAKNEARNQGADDAWLVSTDIQHKGTGPNSTTPADVVNEGTSSNAWIVDARGTLITPDLSNALLAGITRAAILACARETGQAIQERAFTVAEAQAASEAFVTSATSLVTPVVQIDGQWLGDGRPGRVSRRLLEIYIAACRQTIS